MILFWNYNTEVGWVPTPAHQVAEKLGISFESLIEAFEEWKIRDRYEFLYAIDRGKTRKGKDFHVFIKIREYRTREHPDKKTGLGWITLCRTWGHRKSGLPKYRDMEKQYQFTEEIP